MAGWLCALAVASLAPGQQAADNAALKDKLSETKHTIAVGGSKLDYTATAGTLVLKDENGKPTASMFFIAYTKAGVGDLAKRPLTFAFNGGPGSSAVWLQLGALGPRRVVVGDVGERVDPPYKLVDNESTILDLTDLVFIDPVTTGYSRAAPGHDAKHFHGVQGDIESVGELIRLYTTRYKRWDSPKFLAGESYGTTRAAGLVGHMQDRHGMNFNGIILVSSVLNFQTLRFDEGNDLPYALYLPSYTATAWYHNQLSAEFQRNLHQTLAEVDKFALGDYSAALMQGNKLPTADRKEIAHRLARYTGLTEEYVARSNLRIEMGRFIKELLRKQRKTLGRFDSRFTGADLDAVGERPEYDPSFEAVQGPYTATFNDYVRNELKFEKDQPYEVLTGRVQPWDFGSARNRYLNVSPTLRQAMTKNRELRVFVANGYFDLATPYLATRYTFDHLGLSAALADHVTMGYYEAGHMMYVHKPSLQKLKKDLAAFVQGALRR
jgi:carboxypeptidase C (cathepsin A)